MSFETEGVGALAGGKHNKSMMQDSATTLSGLTGAAPEQGPGMKRTMSCASGGTCSTTASTEALHEHGSAGLPNADAGAPGCRRRGRHARTISRTSEAAATGLGPLGGCDFLISEERELTSWMESGSTGLSSSSDAVNIWERIVRSLEEKGRGASSSPAACPALSQPADAPASRGPHRRAFHFQPLPDGLGSQPDAVLRIQKLFSEHPKIVMRKWRASIKEKGPVVLDGQTRSRRENQIWRLWAMSQRHLATDAVDHRRDVQDLLPVRTPSPDYEPIHTPANMYPLRTPSPDYGQRALPPAPLAMPAAQPMCVGFGYAPFGATTAMATSATAAAAPASVGGYYFIPMPGVAPQPKALPQMKQKYRV